MKIFTIKLLLIFILLFTFAGCSAVKNPTTENSIVDINTNISTSIEESEKELNGIVYNGIFIEEFNGNPTIDINNNKPFFAESDITLEEFETYAELDDLGRCGRAFANICKNLMPTEERGEIGHVKPSGWHTIKYDCVDGKYLYNRCHLIGFQLAGENANVNNLITGTRYLNIDGMLALENDIADYVKDTNNHVLYRVTPIFIGDELVCRGVLMEAYSVEDNGEGICFNKFAYNAHPNIYIDYLTGESHLTGSEEIKNEEEKHYTANPYGIIYILNTNSKKYHREDCSSVEKINSNNKEIFNGTIEWLTDNGYKPCGICKPE